MTSEASALSFEAAFAQLEAIVQRLEEGGLGLEEALRLYEEGMRLVKTCTDTIEAAELRLTRLQESIAEPPL
jgi:exodeoxyribonuclease VII small subunit